ncbi:MAG: SDR family oxidoreductase [Asgard group archaeon]|nr:SDR family oxidoreductase [Asgard group archaeon]
MKLENETAIVTGSTTGIGRTIAEFLLKEGCKVTICSRTEEKVKKAVTELKKQYGDSVIGFSCDVTNPDDIDNIVKKTIDAFGSVRILIANAGINSIYGPLNCLTTESTNIHAQKTIGTNLIGVINAVSAVLPQMSQQKYGRIITLSGGGVDRPIEHMTIYSASKGGVVTFSKCLALELAALEGDIKINIFHPGLIRTDLMSNVNCVPNWKTPEEIEESLDFTLDYLGGDIKKRCSKVIPFVTPSCKSNGKVFHGFSVFKTIVRAIKMQRALKKRNQE